MRLAWFRPAPPDPADPLDDSGALVTALRPSHEIEIVTAATAHDFVWTAFRRPYDLCIFELDNTPAHQFIWPYLLHYGGVTLLRTLMLQGSRVAALTAQRRGTDAHVEMTFSGDGRLLRAPLLASGVVVVAQEAAATTLQREYPEASVRFAPAGVKVQGVQGVQGVQQVQGRTGSALSVGVLGATNRLEVVESAIERARAAGTDVTLIAGGPAADVLRDADVVVAVRWPMFGEPETAALAGLAAGKAVIAMETEATADWPAYDPQTWRPRGTVGGAPVAVSIDPRDEEHSLMVAIRGLARDRAMREALGAAAREWSLTHGTVQEAVDAWQRILAEAGTLQPPPRPAGWPSHFTADGTEEARAILGDTGATVDFL